MDTKPSTEFYAVDCKTFLQFSSQLSYLNSLSSPSYESYTLFMSIFCKLSSKLQPEGLNCTETRKAFSKTLSLIWFWKYVAGLLQMLLKWRQTIFAVSLQNYFFGGVQVCRKSR